MTKFKDLTNDEIANIIDWYDKGMYSQRELAEIFGVSRATIRRAVKTTSPVADEDSPDVGQYEEVGQPTDPDVGHSRYEDIMRNSEGLVTEVLAWTVVAALVIVAGFTLANAFGLV